MKQVHKWLKIKSAYPTDHDKLLRPLDRTVIEFLHATNIDEQQFDSARGMFVEGVSSM